MSHAPENANHRYINEFLRLKCSRDMLALELFPNAKEITESFAAYDAVRTHLMHHFQLGDPSVICLVVGDGSTPRTAATFAYRSRWECHSIDPVLRPEHTSLRRIDRLTLHKKKIEACSREDFKIGEGSTVLVVAVHSHAPLKFALAVVGRVQRLAIVAIPCCVPLTIKKASLDIYKDPGIWSPHRTVLIWDLKASDLGMDVE